MICRSNITFGLEMAACHHKPFLRTHWQDGNDQTHLGVKVRASLAAAHGERGQRVLEDLLKPQELDDRQRHRWVEAEPACTQRMVLLRANCQQELPYLTS